MTLPEESKKRVGEVNPANQENKGSAVITLVRGNITTQRVDAIVNAANECEI